MILRWLVQWNIVALPKSTHRERMEQNIDVFDFTLSDEEMAAVTALDTKTSLFFRHDTPEAVDMFARNARDGNDADVLRKRKSRCCPRRCCGGDFPWFFRAFRV